MFGKFGYKVFTIFILLLSFSTLRVFATDFPEITGKVLFSTGWRIQDGDSRDRSRVEYDDTNWRPIYTNKVIHQLDPAGWFWLRNSFTISPELKKEKIYFIMSKFFSPCELYLNGTLIATRGVFPPNYYISMATSMVTLIPSGLVNWEGENIVAIRVNNKGSEYSLTEVCLGDQSSANFELEIADLFNSRLYYLFGAINLFTGVFLLLQYFYRTKDKTNLLYAISAILMSLYFYEIGSPKMLFAFWIVRVIAKGCLILSIAFLIDFFMTYFNIHNNKYIKSVVYSVAIILFVLMLSSSDETVLNNYFILAMYPIQIETVFMLYLVIRATFTGKKYTSAIFIGAIISAGFGTHDIIIKLLGINPFAWFQGIAFFTLDFSLFVSLAMKSSSSFNALEHYTRDLEKKASDLAEVSRAYARFVPKDLLSYVNSHASFEVKLGDQVVKEMTVLVTNIRSFTTMSEQISTEESFALLNSYFKKMIPVIKNEGGIIESFSGDSFVALFPNRPDSAIRASLRMRLTLKEFNDERIQAGYSPIEVGVGIHTGKIMIGIIGEEIQMNSTLLSEAVIIAHQVEELTKDFGVPIMTTGLTIEQVPDARILYAIRYLGQVSIKGKELNLPIYEIIADQNRVSLQKLKHRETFENAVFKYDAGEKETALSTLRALQKDFPDDPVINKYMKSWVQSSDVIIEEL